MGDEHTPHERVIIAMCGRLGISVTRSGIAWKLRGQDIDVTTTDLRMIKPDDLQPATPRGKR